MSFRQGLGPWGPQAPSKPLCFLIHYVVERSNWHNALLGDDRSLMSASQSGPCVQVVPQEPAATQTHPEGLLPMATRGPSTGA